MNARRRNAGHDALDALDVDVAGVVAARVTRGLDDSVNSGPETDVAIADCVLL